MTAHESCELLVTTVRELSATRAECESWRLMALALLRHTTELTRELDMIDQRQYVYRARTQDERDVFIDQRDLREARAA